MSREYFDQFETIINKYLPDYGEGNTFASQAVTAVNKLIYKWFNDGDVYDNTYHLKGWANDLSSYANWLYHNIKGTRYYLNEIKDILKEEEYEEILASLADIVLDEDFLIKANEMPTVGSIYDCDGPFQYREEDEYSDDGEDWYRYFSVKDLLPLTHGDYDAAEIILIWYDVKEAYEDFDDKEDYISFIEDDISDMLDAATSSDEVEIVKKALNIDMDESLNESSKSNYTIEYYLNTATVDRRSSTKEDVEEDYIYYTIQASNDLEALEEAFYIQTREDYYEEIFDDYGVEDTVEGFKDYFDSTDIGDGSIIICKITQGSRVVYDGGLNKQYFLDEVDEEWEDIEEDYKKSKYSLSEIEDAVSTSFGFNKKETKDYIKKSSPEVLDALVAGFKAEASKSFLTDDLKKKEPEIKLEGEDSKEIDEGEAVFTKKNGTPGYLVKDGGKEKFLRNYTEKQVKDLGFKIKKNTTEDILKEGFYEGGFPNFESFKDSAEYEYNGIQIFAVPLNDGLISVTGQWKKDGGKFGKAQPDEKIYRTTNKNLAIKTYIDKYLKNFLDKNLKDIDKNPDAYWD